MHDDRVSQSDLGALTDSESAGGEPIVFARSNGNFWDVSEDGPDLQRHLSRLDRLSRSWWQRAGIRKPQPLPTDAFDERKPDFVVDLLPFHDHPVFLEAPEELQQKVLSCAWLAYNEKTAAVEAKIVGPACFHLLNGDVSEFRPARFRATIAEAVADEAFHIILVDKACRVSRERRGLEKLQIPSFELVTNMQRRQDQCAEQSKKVLVQLATAIVSETLISDYLGLLSTDATIQPMNRITTDIHRRDELAHNGLFKTLGALIYHGLNQRERQFFVQALTEPCAWFASAELEAWRSMLLQIKFPQAEVMINDCQAEQRNMEFKMDLTTLESLFTELEVEPSISRQAFHRPGRDSCAGS